MLSEDKYWVYEPRNNYRISGISSYPQALSNFKGIPNNLDDVLLIGKKVYFFKNGDYYKLSDNTLKFQVRFHHNYDTRNLKTRLEAQFSPFLVLQYLILCFTGF